MHSPGCLCQRALYTPQDWAGTYIFMWLLAGLMQPDCNRSLYYAGQASIFSRGKKNGMLIFPPSTQRCSTQGCFPLISTRHIYFSVICKYSRSGAVKKGLAPRPQATAFCNISLRPVPQLRQRPPGARLTPSCAVPLVYRPALASCILPGGSPSPPERDKGAGPAPSA